MKLQAVVFDFDGVILDTEMARYEAWQRIFCSYGQTLPLEIWVQSIGRAQYAIHPFDVLRELVTGELDYEQIRNIHKEYELEQVECLGLLPGVQDRIEEAHDLGIRLGLASSSSRSWVERHLTRRDLLGYFDCIICREDTNTHKPSPEPYRTVLQRMGCIPDNSVAVEDSPLGIEAAVNAGLYCLGVGCSLTKGLDLSRASRIISSLQEISWVEFT